MLVLLFLGIIASSVILTAGKDCAKLFERKSITSNYPKHVAHGTHSLTLNDIQAFFKPDADENNGITIVNFNLTDENILLPNAPAIQSSFSFSAMFALDHVLSNMEDNSYDFKNGNALDRLAHNLHMQETWANAAKVYKKMKRMNSKKRLCSCLDEVYGPWITKSLLYLAKEMREPEEVYTGGSKRKQKPAQYYYVPRYGGGCCNGPDIVTQPPRSTEPFEPFEPFELQERVIGKRSAEGDKSKSGIHHEESIPNITDEDTWAIWKNMTYSNMNEELEYQVAYNLATFLRCKLN